VVVLFFITFFSLLPVAELPPVPGSDKTHHFVAYAALVFPAALAHAKHLKWLILGFFLWSGAIELIQPYVNRYGEWLDLLANSTGLVIGLLMAILLRRLFKV